MYDVYSPYDPPTLPFIAKPLPKEGLIQHARNSQLKKDMYYIVETPGMACYGQCMKINKWGTDYVPEQQISLNT